MWVKRARTNTHVPPSRLRSTRSAVRGQAKNLHQSLCEGQTNNEDSLSDRWIGRQPSGLAACHCQAMAVNNGNAGCVRCAYAPSDSGGSGFYAGCSSPRAVGTGSTAGIARRSRGGRSYPRQRLVAEGYFQGPWGRSQKGHSKWGQEVGSWSDYSWIA